MTHELAALFRRDLTRLAQEIEAFPNDEALWKTLPGITNPAGNLALHLEGNLREYVGRQLGRLSYTRKRDLEFSSKGVSQKEIISRLADLQRTIPTVIEGLSAQQLEMEYPQIVLGVPTSTRQFLVSLYGHLSWHLGQIDYLRRTLTGDGALKLAQL
jgi:hypothetical protein